MRLALPAACLLTLALPSSDLATRYVTERALRVDSTWSIEIETSMEVVRDGEPVEAGFGGSSTEERRVVYVDEVLEATDDAPSKVRRSFGDVKLTSEASRGGEARTNERDSPLAGLVLELTDRDGDVELEIVDGHAPDDEAVLGGQQLTLRLDAFLPEDDVKQGDTWELESETLLVALGLDARLFPAPEAEEGGAGGRGRRGRRGGGGSVARLLSVGDWSGKATLFSMTEELDGSACAAIDLMLECEGDLVEALAALGGRGGGLGGDVEGDFGADLEGRLYFSLEEGRPLRLELEGSMESNQVMERKRGESSMRMESTRAGSLEIVVEVSPIKD